VETDKGSEMVSVTLSKGDDKQQLIKSARASFNSHSPRSPNVILSQQIIVSSAARPLIIDDSL
jgi:hypothetical protein